MHNVKKYALYKPQARHEFFVAGSSGKKGMANGTSLLKERRT
jgi:hypothetical protein